MFPGACTLIECSQEGVPPHRVLSGECSLTECSQEGAPPQNAPRRLLPHRVLPGECFHQSALRSVLPLKECSQEGAPSQNAPRSVLPHRVFPGRCSHFTECSQEDAPSECSQERALVTECSQERAPSQSAPGKKSTLDSAPSEITPFKDDAWGGMAASVPGLALQWKAAPEGPCLDGVPSPFLCISKQAVCFDLKADISPFHSFTWHP